LCYIFYDDDMKSHVCRFVDVKLILFFCKQDTRKVGNLSAALLQTFLWSFSVKFIASITRQVIFIKQVMFTNSLHYAATHRSITGLSYVHPSTELRLCGFASGLVDFHPWQFTLCMAHHLSCSCL